MFLSFVSKPLSITSKLTLLYALASFLALASIALVMYFAIRSLITVSASQYMIDESVVIHDLIQQYPNDLSALVKEINGVPHALKNSKAAFYHYFIRLYDYKGNVLQKTPGMPSYLKHRLFPLWKPGKPYSPFINWESHDQRQYLLFAAPVEYRANRPVKYIEMAFDISYPYSVMRSYAKWIALGLFLCLFIIVALARYLTKQGLSQLYKSAHQIRKLKASDLAHPLDTHRWPQELLIFGDAFNELLSRINNVFKRLIGSTTELAHELRTPINNLIIQTEVVLLNPRSVEKYCDLLSENLKNYNRLTRLINSILLLAKCDNPATTINKKSINLSVEMNRICNDYRLFADEKKIKINLSGSGLVLADPDLLERVLINILVNAIKYNKLNGSIDITIKSESDRTTITFLDTGKGIPRDMLNDVCKQYCQAYNFEEEDFGHTELQNGIGLGLTLSCSIMRLHKGTLCIDSEFGKWTSVTLEFRNDLISSI